MSKDWKNKLLSSGVPLEHDVGRILAANGFNLSADFSFMRRDMQGEKEFSVDIEAFQFREQQVFHLIDLLVECKYRSDEKVVLLLPEPNTKDSLGTLGGTVSAYDEFMPFSVASEPFVEWERFVPFAYKGLELHRDSAVEKDFREGIQQLRYATPSCLRRRMEFSLWSHREDVHPFFFAKFYVTNAPLFLLRDDVGIEEIREAKDLREVAQEVDNAILVSDYGPDYQRHCREVFRDSDELLKSSKSKRKELVKAGKDVKRLGNPVELVKEFRAGRGYELRSASTQFFICRLTSFGPFLGTLLEVCEDSLRHRLTMGR